MLPKVLNLYKKIGETPLECLEEFKKTNPKYRELPMTYAGRLDPMAEGILLVLVGEECKKKDKYLELEKEYEGAILFGFSSDTGDVLGIPVITPQLQHTEKLQFLEVLQKEAGKVADKLVGKRVQKYPKFSSKTVRGPKGALRMGKKSLWQWAREGREVEIPKREVEIYSFEITSWRCEKHSNILQNVRMLVNKVRGDFRQEEILAKWRELLKDDGESAIAKFRAHVSSGTYIRVLVEELGEYMGVRTLLYSLKRTRVGDYRIEDSVR